jgi:SAM-dependent methyltransferase
MARAERRLIDDARRIGLPEAELTAEQARRAAPLRGGEEGRAVERAEFALSRAERIGGAPRARLGWRARQRVRGDYVHRDAPTPQTKRSQNNQWRAYAYLNAKRIADAIGARKIVDFGCGTGSKLIETFGALDTLGIEIEPALGGLRRRMPDRVWLDGQILDPRAFDADLVICCDALEHQTEPDRLLSAMAASRAKAFILTTPALELLAERGAPRLGPPRDPTHVYEWTTSEFAELVGDHLHLVAHAIVDQRHAIQLCVAVRRDDPAALSALFPTNASADLICAPPHPKNGPQTRKRK